ncbi:MAG: hypothetical protein IAE88_11655 [Rhodobacteraceae bacterium]|nr:hypothetical protein [Paracoccaceae bacterium]
MGIGLGLNLAGAGLDYLNKRKTAKAQGRILAEQTAQQAARQAEADQAIAGLLAQRAGSSAAPLRGAIGDEYLGQVLAAMPNATPGLNQVGALSNAYRNMAGAAATGVGDYGTRMASLMARMDAPTRQRVQEGQQEDRLRSTLGLIGRQSDSDRYLAELRLRGVKPNPWMSAASSLLGAAGSAVGSRAGGGFGSPGAGGGMGQFGNNQNWIGDPSLWGG